MNKSVDLALISNLRVGSVKTSLGFDVKISIRKGPNEEITQLEWLQAYKQSRVLAFDIKVSNWA